MPIKVDDKDVYTVAEVDQKLEALRTELSTPTPTPPTPTPPTPTPPTPTPTPPTEKAIFVGDYSTGDFSQWDVLQCRGYNSNADNFPPTGKYQAQVLNDNKYGKAARWEVRSGDNPGFSPGTERSQVQAGSSSGGREGEQRWYRMAVKFDPNFPKNHKDLGWGVTHGWHPNSPTGSGPIQWMLHWQNGYWSFVANLQSAPGVYEKTVMLWQIPIGTDWHDIKLQVNFSTSDSKGWVRLWHNGVRQKFVNGADTYNIRTIVPGTTGTYFKEGYYRQSTSLTAVLYTAAFRCGASEASV